MVDPDQVAGDTLLIRNSADAGQRDRSLSAVNDAVHTAVGTSSVEGQDAGAGASQGHEVSEQSSATLQTAPLVENETNQTADDIEPRNGPSDDATSIASDDERDLSEYFARHYFDCIAGTSTGGYVNHSRLIY
jgi:hypothetical protein